MVQRMYRDERWGLTRERPNQGFPFHLIASFSTRESCKVPEGCCCQLRWRSGRSGFCNRSSVTEPGSGANRLIYLRFDDVTGGATRSVLCSLSSPVFSNKMAASPSKMVDGENKMAASSQLSWDRATGITTGCASSCAARAKGWY